MFQILLNGLLIVVGRILSAIFSPLITALGSIFGSLAVVFGYLLQFLQLGLTYFVFFCKLFMVPSGALIMFFSFLGVIIVFNSALYVVGISVAIYRFFRGGSSE